MNKSVTLDDSIEQAIHDRSRAIEARYHKVLKAATKAHRRAMKPFDKQYARATAPAYKQLVRERAALAKWRAAQYNIMRLSLKFELKELPRTFHAFDMNDTGKKFEVSIKEARNPSVVVTKPQRICNQTRRGHEHRSDRQRGRG